MTSVSAAIVSPMEKQTADRCVVPRESKRLPCDACGTAMEPEHAHYRCRSCGYILPCCGW